MRKVVQVILVLLLLTGCITVHYPKPERLVGLNMVSNVTCTTFQLDSRIFLTSAHCITSDQQAYTIIDSGGRILAMASFVITNPDFYNLDKDWAFVITDKEVNNAPRYKLGDTKNVKVGDKLLVEGYKHGHKFESFTTRVEHTMPSGLGIDRMGYLGVSGGPVTPTNDRFTVIGIFSRRLGSIDMGFVTPITEELVETYKSLKEGKLNPKKAKLPYNGSSSAHQLIIHN